MWKARLKYVIYFGILASILTGAYLVRITVLKDKPRNFLLPSYISRLLALGVLSFALFSIDNRIIRLFSYERALNFLLSAIFLALAWIFPRSAYPASTLTNLLSVFATLWFLAAVALESAKYSLLILVPFLILFLLFFDSFTNMKGASSYYGAFTGFGVKTGLVLLTFITYEYVVRDLRIDTDVAFILAGWLMIFASSQFSTIRIGLFNLLHFHTLIYIRMFIYFGWFLILVRRWWLGSEYGDMDKQVIHA